MATRDDMYPARVRGEIERVNGVHPLIVLEYTVTKGGKVVSRWKLQSKNTRLRG